MAQALQQQLQPFRPRTILFWLRQWRCNVCSSDDVSHSQFSCCNFRCWYFTNLISYIAFTPLCFCIAVPGIAGSSNENIGVDFLHGLPGPLFGFATSRIVASSAKVGDLTDQFGGKPLAAKLKIDNCFILSGFKALFFVILSKFWFVLIRSFGKAVNKN